MEENTSFRSARQTKLPRTSGALLGMSVTGIFVCMALPSIAVTWKPFVSGAGVGRRGVAGIDKFTDGKTKPRAGITNWRNEASDHAAVWANLNI